MIKPANTAILDHIDQRMRNIRQTYGYFNTIKAFHRTKSEPFVIDEMPVINYFSAGLTNLEHKYGLDIRTLSISIAALGLSYERPLSDISEELAADVITALNRSHIAPKPDDPVSFNLGGLVSKVNYLGHDYIISDDDLPWAGVLINLEVVYKAKTNDLILFES